MTDDFYTHSARQRLAQIEATKAQALADLANAKATADYETAALSVQTIADLEAQKVNVINLHEQYMQSQTPPTPPELSTEERNAKPWNRMTPDDALALARTSKYAKKLDWDDANVQAGYREAMARRARGE
jgi:hypothetical protein